MRCYRKAQSKLHPRTVHFDGRFERIRQLRELHYLAESFTNVRFAHPKYLTVEPDILPRGQLRMDPGPDLNQRADASPHADPATRGISDPRDDTQRRRLSRPVWAHDGEGLSLPDRSEEHTSELQSPYVI